MTDMQEAWSRMQHSLPPALTTQESLWLRPDGTGDGGLGEGYDDLVKTIRAALDRL